MRDPSNHLPNHLHLAEALASGWSLHLPLAAWESETTNSDNPDRWADYLAAMTWSLWDFERLWKYIGIGLKHQKTVRAEPALGPQWNDVVGQSSQLFLDMAEQGGTTKFDLCPVREVSPDAL